VLPGDRLLILAPHPDDETIGCGGVIQQAVTSSVPVKVVYLTNGDSNEWSFMLYERRPEVLPLQVERMGSIRRSEAIRAAAVLGLSPENLVFLGYPDFGTLNIWESHWGNQAPFRALLTRATAVPYADAFRPGASYKGEEILHDLTSIIEDFRPTKICLPHPADQNPDHLAFYLFTRVALWDLRSTVQAELFPYLTHYPAFPLPRGYFPQSPLRPPPELAEGLDWVQFPLTQAMVDRKLAALREHRTQLASSASYLLSFVRRNELFGDYPRVDLRGSASLADAGQAAPLSSASASTEMSESLRAMLVGLELRTIRIDGEDLVVTLHYSRPLARGVAASVYLFGYRKDRAFATMPKLHIRIGELGRDVLNQDRLIPGARVEVKRGARDTTIRVPLSLLGNPDKVLASARTYAGNVPLDRMSWRVLEVAGDSK